MFKVLWNEPPIGAFPIVTVIIMVLSYVLAATVKDLSTVLALVGATGSTTICYILPGLFYYKANQNMNKPQDVLSYIGLLMIVMGVFVMGSSLTALAYGATAGH